MKKSEGEAKERQVAAEGHSQAWEARVWDAQQKKDVKTWEGLMFGPLDSVWEASKTAAFMSACMMGRLDAAKRMADEGAKPNGDAMTVLSMGFEGKNLGDWKALAQLALEAGELRDTAHVWGPRCAGMAVERSLPGEASTMLDFLEGVGGLGNLEKLLLAAIDRGRPEAAGWLLSRGVAWTPQEPMMARACKSFSPSLVGWALARGEDPRQKIPMGSTKKASLLAFARGIARRQQGKWKSEECEEIVQMIQAAAQAQELRQSVKARGSEPRPRL